MGDLAGLSATWNRSLSGALMAKSELSDESTVTLDIGPLQILEKPTTTADHLEKAAATVVVFRVGVEVCPQVVDASREDRDLNGGAPTIGFVELVLLDDFLSIDRHVGVLPPRESVAAREAMLL
jgi:hypothetical protein